MIHIFIGTKAQLIKMAPVMVALTKRKVAYNFVFSGQHTETIADILSNFDLKQPDVVLYKGADITSIFKMMGWAAKIALMRHKTETIWRGDRNGIVLNHGDTFSTLLGAVLAKMAGLKTGHVESGLRSFHLLHPFPEELTRRLVFLLSDYYYAPGAWAMENLSRYKGHKVNTLGNTLMDALRLSASEIDHKVVEIPKGEFGIVSIHRFENIFRKEKLNQIVDILIDLSIDRKLLFILHAPTKKKLIQFGLMDKMDRCANIELRPRYDYFTFIKLLKKASFMVTDGGSNQEECAYLKKTCVLMRKKTERQEGVGLNVLISRYNLHSIRHFLAQDSRAGSDRNMAPVSPSRIIVDDLLSRGKAFRYE